MQEKFDSKPNKNKWIAYDNTGTIHRFKRDYGVRVYAILKREDKLFI